MSPTEQNIAISKAVNYPAEYHEDLNACREFEKTLNHGQQWDYMQHLRSSNFCAGDMGWIQCHATAPQRCEAFLRTVGRWVE